MIKYSNVAIVASFLGLWIDSFFNHRSQIFVGFLIIFTFGILHGANDLLLIDKLIYKKKTNSRLKTLLSYISVVLIGSLLFYIIPWVTLSAFVIVSGYHFGEQQWESLNKNSFKFLVKIFQLVYGLFILFLLFNFHSDEVQKIVFAITGVNFPSFFIPLFLKIFGIIFIVLGLYFLSIQGIAIRTFITEIFYLVVFTVIFKSSSLIWGFALYFVLWHSLPSIIDQIKFVYGYFSLTNFISYFKSAFIYWIASLLGISILYLVFKDEKIFNALFFSFLASITFPHVFVVTKMFNRK
jgi:Brp/Blh family beta-carotene 15,15'-monooxygenase